DHPSECLRGRCFVPLLPPSSSLKNSVPNRYRPAVVDAAADARVGPVFAKSAVAHGQHPRFVVDGAADAAEIGCGGPVTTKSAVRNSQRRAAVGAIVVDAATAKAGGIAAERALIDRQGSVIVVNAGTERDVPLAVSIRDGQAGDGGGNPTAHV